MSQDRSTLSDAIGPAAVNASCRLPLLGLSLAAAVWLVVGSVLGLIASIKFHSPTFLADAAWLSYGCLRPASLNALVYGFCVPAGLGAGLWMLARLGRCRLAQPWLVIFGTKCWNLGVAVGVGGILAGDATGFENLDMPGYAAVLVFLGYVLMGVPGALTFHQRHERELFPSQYFLLAALFWFPWIYSTANLLLVTFPVRGVTQAVIAWWYGQNFLTVWLSLVGLAALFYFLPRFTGRELHSRYLALFTFWTLVLFASWGGIPVTAPVPAWMPTTSTVATALTLVSLIAVGLNLYPTAGRFGPVVSANPHLSFLLVGTLSFLAAGLMKILLAAPGAGPALQFTWFSSVQSLLGAYGFFAMVMFAALYAILPQVTGLNFPFARLVRAHFWMAAVGVLLIALPLALGGIRQAIQLQDAQVAFTDVAKGTLLFLRVSTIGDLLLLAGHLMFFANVAGLALRVYRAPAAAACAAMTADLFKPAEVKP